MTSRGEHPLDVSRDGIEHDTLSYASRSRGLVQIHPPGCCYSAVAPAYVQISPPTSVAAGRISTASPSDRASEIIPTSAGDGTSPSVWIVKMLRATAVARIAGDTTLTMVELIGPVEMNISTWAVTSAAQ